MVEPLIRHEPPAVDHSLLEPALELAASAGLVLDPAQTTVLRGLLARGADGRWAAFETGVVEPRQNGKGGILEARELAGVELCGETLLIHSAHEYATALEAFYRMLALLEACDIAVAKVRNAHGEQGIDFANGARLRYRTRTRGGGRGFSCDFLALDEAMFLPEFAHGALLPTMSARENPQVIYSGSAVDQNVHEHGIVLSRVRERALAGEERLAYFEWALPFAHPDEVPDEVASDPAEWAKANPALGIRIREEHVRSELSSMAGRTFAVERLGVGDWPATDGVSGVISLEKWAELVDAESEIHDPVCLAFDVSPDRRGSIAAGGRNAEGFWHVELVDARQGTAWIPRRLAELADAHMPLVIATDPKGPGGSLVVEVSELLKEHGHELQEVTATEHAQACGLLIDAVDEGTLRHLGDPRLESSIRGAQTRPLGDAFAWARRSSSVDISPLVAVTLSLWATMGCPDESQELAIY